MPSSRSNAKGIEFIPAAIFHSFEFGNTNIRDTLTTKLKRGMNPKRKGTPSASKKGLFVKIPTAIPMAIKIVGMVKIARKKLFIDRSNENDSSSIVASRGFWPRSLTLAFLPEVQYSFRSRSSTSDVLSAM